MLRSAEPPQSYHKKQSVVVVPSHEISGWLITQHYCGDSGLIHNSKLLTQKASALALADQEESRGSRI